jgi:hypothetical protein
MFMIEHTIAKMASGAIPVQALALQIVFTLGAAAAEIVWPVQTAPSWETMAPPTTILMTLRVGAKLDFTTMIAQETVVSRAQQAAVLMDRVQLLPEFQGTWFSIS